MVNMAQCTQAWQQTSANTTSSVLLSILVQGPQELRDVPPAYPCLSQTIMLWFCQALRVLAPHMGPYSFV